MLLFILNDTYRLQLLSVDREIAAVLCLGSCLSTFHLGQLFLDLHQGGDSRTRCSSRRMASKKNVVSFLVHFRFQTNFPSRRVAVQ